ncbi:MAG: ATP-binding protein [Bdellovibrionales bacterium]
MLDQGYSIEAIEMLNWGNFHGLQKVSLRSPQQDGLLFSSPPASAIIGINGSGKSTLIDGLMMALLPFENSLKLGVTNDVEGGSSGGRTIRDYVLGKFSSSGEEVGSTLEHIYGRKDGCSIFLVRLRHNRHPDRVLVFGRCWWYQNFRVNDTQLAFIHYENLAIEQLCENRIPPRNARAFRELQKSSLPSLQVFDTMNNYFMSLSSALGHINKDDLKILNRAFYVKSISQIDQFIRENMLIEHDNPHLDRLLENVRNGQEIAQAIHSCNQKITAIERILKQLKKLQDLAEKKKKNEYDQKLLSLYKDWSDLEALRLQIQSERSELQNLESTKPTLEATVGELTALRDRLQQQLYQKDVDTRLQHVELEIKHLTEKETWLRELREKFENRVKKLKLKTPLETHEWPAFQEKLQAQLDVIDSQSETLNSELEGYREKKIQLEADCKAVREELEHLSKFKTLIPKELYSIKEAALEELNLPDKHLYFVGELIQIKTEHRNQRRAIESVLFPISRNLLCHPDSLNALTKWLDSKGLKADITVKRIKLEELEVEVATPECRGQSDMILEMIDILPKTEHPFASYLWKWLIDVFDYKLVPVSKFKSEEKKLVTSEGLVKTDNRTFRKLKTNFSYSLGWDNRETLESLTQKLIGLNEEFQGVKSSLEAGIKNLHLLDESRRDLSLLNEKNPPEFLMLPFLRQQIQNLASEKSELLKSNPDYLKIKRQVEEAIVSLDVALGRLGDCKAQIQSKTQFLEKVTNVSRIKERELKTSILYAEVCSIVGDDESLNFALSELHQRLEKSKTSRISYEADLRKSAQEIEGLYLQITSRASQELGNYRREYADPNVLYSVSDSLISDLVSSWEKLDERLRLTELPQAQEKWRKFFDQILLESVKDMINEVKAKAHETSTSIQSINEVLKLTNFEDLPTEKRYLKIDIQASSDERIRKFKRQMDSVEKILGPAFRSQAEVQSESIMSTLTGFVEELQKDPAYRLFVTDVRNHFHFKVQSLRRMEDQPDIVMETFTGARKDAKSSAQTTQLAYVLLASCIAFRFRFHDPTRGKDTPRLLVLDEFGGKFDNEKPKEILKLLAQMGFQSLLVSPMSKADLLAEYVDHLVLVHKVSASHSKTQSYPVASKQEYDRLIGKRAREVTT